MGVKTKFSKEELKKILSEYEVGAFLESKPFKRGYVQTNILLKTSLGRYVLRYYEHREREYVLFEVNILHYFHNHNYPCAMPIRNMHGVFIGKHKGKYYAIFEYVPGRHFKNLGRKQFHEMVKHLAKLHNLSQRYKPKYYQHRESHDQKQCIQTARTEAKRFGNKKEGQERYKYIISRFRKLRFPKNIPKGVVHCDFDKANLKFRGDKVVGVLDFDDACYTYLIYDIGMVILYWAWFHEKRFNFAKAKEIVKIYNKYRKLSEPEKSHVYDALQIVMILMMSWFLYDKWKGKDLYKILRKMLENLDKIGRKEFYKSIFN